MLTKAARIHARNALAARRNGNRRLARTFLRFARAAMARQS